jgi:F0F1-type ATP synthase assembly protein I
VAFYSGLGFIIPAGAVGGYALGWLLDGWLHTRPVLSLVMGVAGAASGIVEVIRILTRAERDEDKNSKSGPGAS